MNTFDERKKGFEAKYINDQESEFKIRAKRNKLIGLWAAEIIKPSNVDLSAEIKKTGSYEAKINLHPEIQAKIHIEVVKEEEKS